MAAFRDEVFAQRENVFVFEAEMVVQGFGFELKQGDTGCVRGLEEELLLGFSILDDLVLGRGGEGFVVLHEGDVAPVHFS